MKSFFFTSLHQLVGEGAWMQWMALALAFVVPLLLLLLLLLLLSLYQCLASFSLSFDLVLSRAQDVPSFLF